MIDIIKKNGTRLFAYKLGESHPEIDRLISEGKIVPHEDGTFEVMSLEAYSGRSGNGQLARTGDYIKIDSSGFPYPNNGEYFAANHRRISGDEYEQIPKPLKAWTVQEPMCEEIQFLMEHKDLVIAENDASHYFTAPLWGTIESAPKDAVVVFYRIERDSCGKIVDAEFNFVVRDAFEKTYDIIEK